MSKVSVIIPSYNCARFLPEAIESALNQTCQGFEIIIIDDGSTDNTKEIVAVYIAKYPDKIRYFYQENKGLAAARNTGIRNSSGEFIALLDSDDKWMPDRLEQTLKAIESDKAIGLVHGNITRISEEGAPVSTPTRNQRFLTGNIFDHIFLRRAHVSCPTVLFRKECCDRVGLFDENLARLGCEDRELWLRIARHYKILYIDKVLAYYRMNMSSMSQDKEKMMKARLYVIDKFCPPHAGNQKLRKKALARVYKDLGDELLCDRKFRNSQEQYLKAISLDPFSFWAWINLIKTIFKIKVKYV